MILDMPLLRMRYEILNIALSVLADEIKTPLSILASEATEQNWTQWWPAEVHVTQAQLAAPPTVTPPVPSDDSSEGTDPTRDTCDTIDWGDEADSPLEAGAQAYIRDMSLRLQVFQMAKDAYLSHKYAALESALIDAAKEASDLNLQPQELKQLSALFKDLASNMAQGNSMTIGTNDDGLPTVIIRDLRGKEPK